MSRLPRSLQPAWPLVKRAHRLSTRAVGGTTRRLPVRDDRSVPRRVNLTADESADRETAAVTLHPGGPAEQLRRPIPVGEPADHWVFQWRSQYDVPRRFTLDLAGGSVVGTYSAHLTPAGDLDFETSAYFGISGWQEHPLFLRRRLPQHEDVDGTVASLAVAGSAANYYHFVMDVLPRWGILKECLPGARVDALYVNRSTRFQKTLLAMTGLDDLRIIDPAPNRAVRARRLLVPSLANPDLMAPTWTTSWLKDRLPPVAATGLPQRLYITRGSVANTRRMVGEELLLPELEKRGFVTLDPGTLSVQEQIDHFAAAQVIVAPHGAALTNLTFCNPGVRVLELFAPNYVNPCYWTIVDNIEDARYQYLVGRARSARRESATRRVPMNGVLTDIAIEPARIIAALDELLS